MAEARKEKEEQERAARVRQEEQERAARARQQMEEEQRKSETFSSSFLFLIDFLNRERRK